MNNNSVDLDYFYGYDFVHQPQTIPPISPVSPDDRTSSPELVGEKNTPVNGPGPKKSSSSRRAKKNRVPRPRNAFMIFRSEFWAGEKISRNVEHDHRHISRIVGHCWNRMPEQEKAIWRQKAEQEKLEHMRQYPDYRFHPSRIRKFLRRNVKRNGEEEMERCKRVADLLIAGKEGEELERAINSIVASTSAVDQECADAAAEPHASPRAHHPAFRSPLLPPSQIPSPRAVHVSSVNRIACASYDPYGASMQLGPSSDPIGPSNTLFAPSRRLQSSTEYYRPDHARPRVVAQSPDAHLTPYSYSPPRVYSSPYSYPLPEQCPEGRSSTYGQSQTLFQAVPDVPACPAYTPPCVGFRNPFADADLPLHPAYYILSNPIGPLDMSLFYPFSSDGTQY